MPRDNKEAGLQAAAGEFRAAVLRTDNMVELEAISVQWTAVIRLLGAVAPDLLHGRKLDRLLDLAEALYRKAPVDEFGGNDAPLTSTFLNVTAAAVAHEIQKEAGIAASNAASRVSTMCGGRPSRTTILKWMPGGERWTDDRARSFEVSCQNAREVADRLGLSVEQSAARHLPMVARSFCQLQARNKKRGPKRK